jgi:murein L,D-transpeptidase YafK
MIASPQRRPRSLVAIIAATFFLPAGLSAQAFGGPATLGEPLFPGLVPVSDPESMLETAPPSGLAPGFPRGLANAAVAGPTRSFRDEQLRFQRVRSAYQARAGDVRRIFVQQQVTAPAEIFFRVFKREQLMEVWARDADAQSFVLVNTYAMCGTSGQLGSKRAKGDAQIPEGFYSVDVFNPTSRFHLSLGVDYPNAVDRARAGSRNLGGDIFIHGGCATVGCVPVSDEGIEEVYVMALMARDAGQRRIPVHMFPTRLDEDGFAWLRATFGPGHHEFAFWENLREGYLAFERTRTVPTVDHHQGRYTFPRGVPSSPVPSAADVAGRDGSGTADLTSGAEPESVQQFRAGSAD